jgi:tetratricopeptide (TPR) repeat protein
MGFRDNFIDGYLLTPVGPRQRTFAQWSLENTVEAGLRANQQQVQTLRENLRSTFEAGISRLEQSQMQAAKLLQRELQYQADNIVNAVDRGSADVVDAVQKACDYLGGQLCEVRWAIEKHAQISQQILQVLLTALDNASRQYWEQGVKCYETAEYEIAKERFNRALDSNRTNYFAYQYLGLIAVHDESSHDAIKNFDLARKFAENGYYRALALSHLARAHHATGDLLQAVKSSIAATEAAPDHAKFWYEAAVYQVRNSNVEEAIRCLRQAITTDWMYWSISLSDANLEPIRNRVERLLAELREEQRVIARHRLDHFAATVKTLRGWQMTAEIVDFEKRLANCETSYRSGTVFAYRDLVQPALDGEKQALGAAIRVLDQRIVANRAALTQAQAEQTRSVSKANERIREGESLLRQWENSPVRAKMRASISILGSGKGQILSLIEEAKQKRDQVKADSESKLGQERAMLDREHEGMTGQKKHCQSTLQSL